MDTAAQVLSNEAWCAPLSDATANGNHPGNVLLTVTDQAYHAGFDNLVATARWSQLALAVVALDVETRMFFENHQVHVLDVPEPLGIQMHKLAGQWRRDTIVYDAVHRLLSCGLRVIY